MANPNDIQWDDAPAASTGIKWDDDTGVQWDDQPAKPRGFLEHLGGLWDRNAGALRQAAGGVLQAVGEAPRATRGFLAGLADEMSSLPVATGGSIEDRLGNEFDAEQALAKEAGQKRALLKDLEANPNAVASVGRAVAEQGRDVTQQGAEASAVRRPDSVLAEPLQALKYYGNEAAGSAVPMAIAVAQPEVGLPLIGGQAFGQEYDERRAKKAGVLESLASGAVHGAAEVIPEVASLGVLRGKIGSALTDIIGEKAAKAVATNVAARIGGSAVAEGGSEVVTQLTQDLYDKFANGDDLTWEQIRERAKDAGLTGAVLGGPLGGAHIAGERATNNEAPAPKKGALESLLEPDKLDGSTVPSATPDALAKMAADRISYLDGKEARTAHETEELDLLRERQNDLAGLAEALGIELKPADEQLALPAPAPITVDSSGVARTPAQVDEEARAQQQAAKERVDLGLTPDVERAQAQRAAASPAEAPSAPAEGLAGSEAPKDLDFGDRTTEQLDAEYNAIPDTGGGRRLDTDLVRELSPEYAADKTKSPLIHKAASAWTKARYQRMLERPVAEGREPVVEFTAGGGGSGKSTAASNVLGDSNADIIYDGTFSNLERARKDVAAALNSGRNVRIVYVYRSPANSVEGAIGRAIRSRRPVPVDVLADAHANAAKVVKTLAQEYNNDDRVSIAAINNDGKFGEAKLMPVEDIPNVDQHQAEAVFRGALEEARGREGFDETLYRAFGGNQAARVGGEVGESAKQREVGLEDAVTPSDRPGGETDTAPSPGAASQPVDTTPRTDASAGTLRTELSGTSIGPALSALEKAGALRIVNDPATPYAGRWEGGVATLNAAHINPGEGIGVALHELGVHGDGGLRGILGDDLATSLVAQLDEWEKSPALGDRYEVAKAARERAEGDKDAPHYDEERLAYAVEEAARRVDAGKATGALREWLGRIMARVRVWLSASPIGKAATKAGAPIRPTAGDLVQLAKSAVLRQAATAEQSKAGDPGAGPKFSRPANTDTAGGELYVDKPAKPGETIRVFRVGNGENLGNKNAGNVDGILKMLAWNDDGESNLGVHPDSKLQVFEYTVPEKTDEYGHLMGGRVRGSDAGTAEDHFGRGKAWRGDNESIWYSFGSGESAKARLVGEVPLSEVRSDKRAQQGGDELFAYTVNDHAWLTKYIADKFGAKFSRPAATLPAAAQSAMQKIGAGTTVVPWKQRLAKLTERLSTKLAQGLVDQFAPLAELDMTSYMQARLSKGTDGALEATFLHGMPKLQDGALAIEKDGKGLQGVLSDLDGEHDQFLAWIAGNRAANLKDEWIVKKDGKETRYRSQGEATIAAAKNGGKAEAAPRERLFTDPEIAGLKALNQGTMANGRSRAIAYAKAHEQFKAYQKAVLDIAEQAGLIDPASRATWESEFYVPFYRVMEDEKTGGVPASNAALVRQQAFKELRGGTNELQDLLANTLANWSHLLTASMRNMAATKAVDAAVNAGIARKVSGAQKGSVWIMRDGKQEHYEVDDDLVFDALNSLEYTGLKGPGMAAAKWFKHALTTGVTISPTFRVRNLLRDTLSVLAVSDSAGYNPLKNLVEGWSGTKHGSDTDVSLLAGGGKVRFGSLLDGNQAKNAKRLIEMGIKDQQILDTPEKVKNALGKAWSWWKEVGDRSETINRAAVYQRAIDAGKTHLEASYEARDLLDFTMGGKWASVRFLTSVIPFMNARAQGIYKLGKSAKANPRRFGAVTGAVAMASALLYLLQKDDDDYKALPDWARDTYWCVKLGDKMLFIPKPFEVGAMGTVVERATELMTAGNDYKAKDFAASLGSLLAGNLSMNPIPQVVKPALEAAFNYDPFRGASIDSMADERLVASQRYDANTSSAAIALSRATGENGISPKRIEHMLKGYFGWLGTQALNVSDLMSRAVVDRPASPKDDFSKVDNLLVAGDFVKDAKGGSSKYVERFYNLQKQLDQLYATATENSKRGNTEAAQDILTRPELAKRPMIEAADKQVRSINAAIKQVRDDPKMPAGLKTRRLSDLNEQRNKLLKQVDEAARR